MSGAQGAESSRTIRFRFENLEIWQRAAEVAGKLFRLADQLRGAALSMPNNIAEGSGSTSKKEFIQFLNIARRSTFENASMILIFDRVQLISEDVKDEITQDLDGLCRMITAFARTLKNEL